MTGAHRRVETWLAASKQLFIEFVSCLITKCGTKIHRSDGEWEGGGGGGSVGEVKQNV